MYLCAEMEILSIHMTGHQTCLQLWYSSEVDIHNRSTRERLFSWGIASWADSACHQPQNTITTRQSLTHLFFLKWHDNTITLFLLFDIFAMSSSLHHLNLIYFPIASADQATWQLLMCCKKNYTVVSLAEKLILHGNIM